MGISFEYENRQTKELHGNNAIEENYDFSTEKELKKTIKRIFKNYQCPNCGGHKMDGNRLIVEIGKIKFFREVIEKGFFGSKYVSKHDKDVWRIYNIYLKRSGFLTPAGFIRCKSCKWEEKGAKGIKWVSIDDVRNGRF